jgi:hypothetical protein
MHLTDKRVENADFVTPESQGPTEMAADEPSATRDQDDHGILLLEGERVEWEREDVVEADVVEATNKSFCPQV